MSSNEVFCPLPIKGLSLDAGLKRRLCCHEDSFPRLSIDKLDDINDGHLEDIEQIHQYCKYSCFKEESITGHSPRIEYLNNITLNDQSRINFLDITFDPTCNLACMTCFPQYSSRVEDLYKKMKITYDKTTCLSSEEFAVKFRPIKEYIKQNLSQTGMIVLTGGEPAINKNLLNFINWLVETRDTQNMQLRIFSNMTYSPVWLSKFLEKFKIVEIVASIDASEEACHYIRYPSKWNTITRHLEDFWELKKTNKNLSLSIHTVVSNLNFVHIPRLIKNLYSMKGDDELIPHFTLLQSPALFSPQNISEKVKRETLQELYETNQIIKNRRIKNLISMIDKLTLTENHLAFYTYLKKIDKIRNTRFKDAGIEI